MSDLSALNARLDRLLAALERIAPDTVPLPDFAIADGFLWQAEQRSLKPVMSINRVELSLLKGIDQQRDLLLENTRRFASDLPANNALLWGARGMGKSSLVKSVHQAIATEGFNLKLIEIHREDIGSLPYLLGLLVGSAPRFIVFCDDLSFETDDTEFKSLKAALDGGIDGRPANTILYATSNRRHLIARDMTENERSTAVTPHETAEEKVSLSDRFGLWLGFHACNQDEYLEMVRGYASHFGLPVPDKQLAKEALEWAITRGARSGRVAWQFTMDLAGRLGVRLA